MLTVLKLTLLTIRNKKLLSIKQLDCKSNIGEKEVSRG